jgi:hypothetical protein
MDKSDIGTVWSIDRAERSCVADSQHTVGGGLKSGQESRGTGSDSFVSGAIVDSWVESALSPDASDRLVLQVARREQPEVLVIVEAEASLVSDRLWLQDLSENLCHGSPVLVLGSWSFNGLFAAARLQFTR